MDIFDKVGKKKKEDKIKKKKTKKDKSSKKPEENTTNGTTVNPEIDEWADEAGVEEVEIVQTKLKTSLQMANLADDKENTEDDGNKDDWANKDQKKENDSEEDSAEKTDNNTEAVTKPTDDEPKKPAGKFVPKHLRGGNESSSRPTLPNSSLINQGLRGPGGRRMFHKEPPKTESHSEFPTLGMAMKEMSTKQPEGFEKVQSDTRGGYRGGNDSAGNQNLSTSNKFGAFRS